MPASITSAFADDWNDYALRGVEPPSVTDVELVLCTDGSFTEATDMAWSRPDLTGLNASSGGQITDTISVDVGADVVTHFEIRHDDVPKIQGSLVESKTGAFDINLRELSRGTAV